MSPQLITIIAGATVSLLAIGAVLWWMNRAPRVRKESDGILPLFGADYDPTRRISDEQRLASRPPTPSQSAQRSSPVASPIVDVPGVADSAGKSAESRTLLAERAAAYAAAADATAAAKAAMAAAMEASSFGPRAEAAPIQGTAPTAMPAPTAAPAPQAKSTSILEFHTRGRPAAPAAPSIPPGVRSPQSSPAVASNSPVVNNAGVPGTMVEGQLLRFSVPAEGTLQFLPGRLEIAAGLDSGREIRFVNVPGPDGTVVTFGRSDGELYRHIQLRDQTVSRSHARMRLLETRWYLLNLSQTNPVVHNGRVLDGGEEHALEDGDRIEMGEVLFTFRSR